MRLTFLGAVWLTSRTRSSSARNSLIVVAAQEQRQESVAGAGVAVLRLGATQHQAQQGGPRAPVEVECCATDLVTPQQRVGGGPVLGLREP